MTTENRRKLVVCVAGFAVRSKGRWKGVPPYLNEAEVSVQIIKAADWADERSAELLVASGGATRRNFPGRTEADSIVEYARERNLSRTPWLAERFARDSAENVAYSVCAAVEHLRSYPDTLAFATFDVKYGRFQLLKAAMNAPFEMQFWGLSPQFVRYSDTNASGESWAAREANNVVEAENEDPLLRRGARFDRKRAERTPLSDSGQPILETDYRRRIVEQYPLMADFLQSWWSGGELYWPELL